MKRFHTNAKKTEWASVIDRNGNEIFFKRGTSHQVRYTWAEINEIIAKGGVRLTHNHPNDSMFSGADVYSVSNPANRLREIAATNARKNYPFGLPRKFADWNAYFADQTAKVGGVIKFNSPGMLEQRWKSLYQTKININPAAQQARDAAYNNVKAKYKAQLDVLAKDYTDKAANMPGTEAFYQARMKHNDFALKVMREAQAAYDRVWIEKSEAIFKDFARETGLDFRIDIVKYGPTDFAGIKAK